MSKYRIQAVAQLTGLSPAVIRAWEARHRLVVPERTACGYRLYSDEDVRLLRGVQQLMTEGMALMQVAALGRPQILARYRQPAHESGPQGPRPAAGLRLQAQGLFCERIDDILAAFAAFDGARAERLLGPALSALPPDLLCQHLLLPLLREIGERWHKGELSVAAEHFGVCLLRSKLLATLDVLRHQPADRQIICACPPGEHHELGLLLFTLGAATEGWRTIYLGANLPFADLRDVVERTRADLVGLSIVQSLPPADLHQLLGQATAAVGGGVPLLIGGRGIEGQEALVRDSGCLLLPPSGKLGDLALALAPAC